MSFSAKQLAALRRDLDSRQVRTREAHGREFSYLEGWYVISEANRIFGYDAWSRETLDSRCVLTRENRGSFLAVYVARVRITVNAHGAAIVREGHGSGEGRGTSPGETHDIAVKAAETDATKRALATFGKPFGLELYRNGKGARDHAGKDTEQHGARGVAAEKLSPVAQLPGVTEGRTGFHPDDTTPIPRPSRYYGRHQNELAERFRAERRQAERNTPSAAATAPPLAPTAPELSTGPIDKSVLTIAEPKRIRDKAHLKFVASQPCLICGRQPCDPHHLRFAQLRAIGMKVSDEFTVPLCRGHHRELHQAGTEVVWWEKRKIKPLEIARQLWEQSHPDLAAPTRAVAGSDQG
jgi:Rad52/22 family double-strand break repair protein